MKKVLLYSLLLSSAALWSCNGDYDDWANPQGYDAENPVGMSLTATSVGDIDFATLSEDVDSIDLFNTVVEIPDGAVLGAYNLTITANGQSADFGVNQNGYVDANELNAFIVSTYGRRPEARQLDLAVSVPVAYQGKQFILRAQQISTNATLVAPNIESAYYFIGGLNGWDIPSSLKFSHSDVNVYDDPVFTLTVDVPATTGDLWWKIIPQSAFEANSWDGLFGPANDGDESWSGTLVENGNAGCWKGLSGQYKITINMLDGTYELSQATELLYTPGNGNGWNFETGWLFTEDFQTYHGYAHLNGEFKITDRPAWGGIEWGAGSADGVMEQGGGNIAGPSTDGLYWVEANTIASTYTYTLISSITLVGDAVGGWDADVALTPSSDFLVWEGDVNFTSGEWKFRDNYGWDYNLGGTNDNLVPNGSNLASPGSGTHHVTLNLRTVPYTCTVK
jgi:hypothetical protein